MHQTIPSPIHLPYNLFLLQENELVVLEVRLGEQKEVHRLDSD
jgi:hypothetical protein